MSDSQALMERVETGTRKATMKALVYHGPGQRAWEDKPRPTIRDATDAIVRITTSTICGTDLHILKGDVPAVTDGRDPRSRGRRRRRGGGDRPSRASTGATRS